MSNRASQANSLYQKLFIEFKLNESHNSGTKCQEDFNTVWIEAKQRFNNDKVELERWAMEKIKEYQQKRCIKKSASILTFFSPRTVDVNNINF